MEVMAHGMASFLLLESPANSTGRPQPKKEAQPAPAPAPTSKVLRGWLGGVLGALPKDKRVMLVAMESTK